MPLAAGSVIAREMVKVGDTHRYSIELQEGEYLQAVVEQQGVDVEEAVLGPDGQAILEMDTFGAERGPEPLAVVAAASGAFSLVLRANFSEPPARYILRIETVRQPGTDDLLRVRAIRATAAQARLYGKGPAEARKALASGQQAVEDWRALGDRRMEMLCEQGAGTIYRNDLAEYREAKLPFERGLVMARELGDRASEGQLLYNLALTNGKLGLFDEARARFEELLALYRAGGKRDREANALLQLGRMLTAAGDPQQALDRLHEAHELYPPFEGFGIAALYVGDAYVELNEYELALARYQKARSLLADSTVRDSRIQLARSLTGIGSALFGLGDLGGARSAYHEALRTWRALGVRTFEAETSLRAGDILREEADLPGARELYESALSLFRSQGNPVGEATAQCRLGDVYLRLDAPAAARAAFEAALAGAPDGNATLLACSEHGLARLAADAGNLSEARAHAEAALEAAESFRGTVASHQTRAATLAAQQALYELLIEVRIREHERDPAGGHEAAALEVSERARARSLLELLAEGRIQLREGVDASLLKEERALGQRLNAEAEAQREALVAKRVEQAEAHARETLDLTAQLAKVQARIRSASPRYAALTQPQPVALPGIQRQVLDEDTLLLEYTLGEAGSLLWVVSTRGLASARLAPRGEIERAARAVYAGLSAAPLAGAQAAGASSWLRDLDALSGLLLPAQVRGLLDRKRLLVVAPGALQYVPFGALRLPEALPLLARFEIVSAPSASVIATLRDESGGRRRPGKAVALFADPVFEPTDPRLRSAGSPPRAESAPVTSRGAAPALERALRSARGTNAAPLGRLPFSGREAEAIAALAPAGQAWKATGFDASREAATTHPLGDYRIVHFATHGLLNTERPELSGLVLSLLDRAGRKQDGFLRLHDVYELELAADLVVLSGCQTALGKELGGEGLVGLTRGLMYAGARSVVASLWQVDDESTAELMKRFYRAMLQEDRPASEALRVAQLELSRSRRWSAPFYWAGFVLQGEWR
jgi:CHAT domain-containing protein/tetratricopeptide (TPR) repeat protein